MKKTDNDSNTSPEIFFRGGGEMGERMRRFDWSKSPLGEPQKWSQALKTSVDICLNSRFPMVIWWGRELVLLYNDDWRPILGINKDKYALGSRGEEVWTEIWDVLKPMFDQVLDTGEATWTDDGLLLVNRYGFTEEAYFTWSYSPILDDDGSVGGVFTAVNETTARVVGERRLKTLRDLGERTLEEARTIGQACRAAAETLAENKKDISFALIYLLDDNGETARLVEAVGISPGTKPAPVKVEIGTAGDVWNFQSVTATGKPQPLGNLEELFGRLTAGAWSDDWTRQAVIVPLAKAGIQDHPAGFLVAGISPRLAFDEDYRSFLELVGGHIATAIANARAYDEEKKRAEALAELDRAKTEFFSNISHEFRTPLTLMLGNLEEVLQKDELLPNDEKEQIETAHRNSLRLLKLVNTLLDFSRIEANRQQAFFEPVDLSELTADLAGNFRSAVEKAGMKLKVNCPPLSEQVYVDREMWEKIVLNLVSNAFKFTLEGEIEISLTEAENLVELRVRDTGVGIPEDQLEQVFERFHRVTSTEGRTHEGTGIGLSLVRELVHQHGGEISVESELGRGATFIVRVPKGKKHLPHRRVEKPGERESFGARAEAFLNEIRGDDFELSDIHEADGQISKPSILPEPSARILLADDNADMRRYIRRLLEKAGYSVVAVGDGQSALDHLQKEEEFLPDLILSDVMMPVLDGFGLLKKIREGKQTREIPFILLSARAGEESKVEGLEAGADDYLIKPFSAKELIARVESNLHLNRLRQESRRQVTAILESITDGFFALDGEWRFVYFNRRAEEYFDKRREEVLGQAIWTVYPQIRGSVFEEKYREAIASGKSVRFEARSLFKDIWLEVDAYPSQNGLSVYFRDASSRKLAEEMERRAAATSAAAAEANAKFRTFFEQGSYFAGVMTIDGTLIEANRLSLEFCGYRREEVIGKKFWDCPWWNPSPELAEMIRRGTAEAAGGNIFAQESKYFVADGSQRDVDLIIAPVKDEQGRVIFLAPTGTDVTERKRAETNAAFLADISRELGSLDSIDKIMKTVGAKIGDYFDLSLCGFVVINEAEGQAIVTHEWRREEAPSVLGSHKLSEFVTDEFYKVLRTGEPFIVCDTAQDTRTRAKVYVELKIGSLVDIPLVRDGEWRFMLGMADSKPRDWRDDEIEMMRELTTRIWTRLERARAEEAVRVSEERLRLALQIAAIGTWDYDYRNRRLVWSDTYFSLLGYETNPTGEATLEMFDARVHPDDFPALVEKFEKAKNERQPYFNEYRAFRADNGELRWFAATGQFFYDAAGEAVRSVGAVHDITERKRAEEKLRESEAQYRALVEVSPQTVWTALAAGHITFVNRHWCEYTGMTLEESRGEGWMEAIHSDHRERIRKAWQAAARVGHWEIEIPFRRIDGEYRWHLTRGLAIYDESGEIERWIGIALDIHERREAEEALRESRTRLRFALESANIGDWDLDLITGEANCSFLHDKCFGATEPFKDWSYEKFLSFVHPEDRAEVERKFGTAIEQQKEWHFECRVVWEDGSIHWIEAHGSIYRSKDDIPLRMLGVVNDITERKESERERERLLAREQDLRREAEEANRLKDEFLATVSHELRTPLNAILGWSTMVRQSGYEEEMMRRAFEIIERNSRNQNQIISDILDVSRIITGKLNLEMQPLELTPVIQAAIDTLQPAISAKRIDLTTEFDQKSKKILGDSDRLQQIVWNLLSNAVKFTPDEGEISVRLHYRNNHAEITVADSGSGIEPEFLPFVFDRFRQADGRMNRKFGGLGLGLAIVRHLVELHGGTVKAESGGIGKGAQFKVYLPLKGARAGNGNNFLPPAAGLPGKTEESKLSALPLSGKKILIVDDEEDALQLAALILKEQGAAVLTASSVDKALELLENEAIEAIVSDIGMPEKDGYFFISEIKNRNIPALALTAYARTEDHQRVLKAGYRAFLPKPVEPEKLIGTVAEIIDEFNAETEQ